MCTSQLKEIADIIQAFATVVAIILGGIWSYMLFVRTRQIYPRANITHRITHRPIASDKLLLHVTVSISNPGDVLLSLIYAEVRIQQVLPLSLELLDSINKGHDPVEEGQREVLWPLIGLRESNWEKGELLEIEPGEGDELHYDFILDTEAETIEVYSYVKNVKKRNREIGWNTTTIHDLRPHNKRENALSAKIS